MVSSTSIDRLAMDSAGYELVATADSGVVFLHADILDTAAEGDNGNQFLFQLALANGCLRAQGGATPGGMTWERSEALGRVEPVLLALRYQDENGYPLAFVPDAPLPLTLRPGAVGTVKRISDVDLWNSTNQAAVIGRPDGGKLSQDGKLRGLCPKSLYAAFNDNTTPKNSLSRPWFIKDGIVPLTNEAPRELNGISRGVRLQRKLSRPLAGQDKATLTVDHVLVSDQPRFQHTEFNLGDAGQWEIVALREERDLRPEPSTRRTGPVPGVSPVGSYRLNGTTGPFSLPAIDAAFAVANLSGPDRVNASGEMLSEGLIPLKAGERVRKNDGTLRALFMPYVGQLRHVEGARLDPAKNQAFYRLLERLPTAADAQGTGRIGPDLKATPTNRALAVADDAEDQSHLVFGGPENPVQVVVDELKAESMTAYTVGYDVFRKFERNWRSLAGNEAVKDLRAKLGILRRPGAVDDDIALKMLDAAIAYLRTSDNAGDIAASAEEAEALGDYLAGLPPDELADDWLSPSSGLALLFEHVWAPANYDLMRRIARFGCDSTLLRSLFGIDNVTALLKVLDVPATGMLQGLVQGVDEIWTSVVDLYEGSKDQAIDALRIKYGCLIVSPHSEFLSI